MLKNAGKWVSAVHRSQSMAKDKNRPVFYGKDAIEKMRMENDLKKTAAAERRANSLEEVVKIAQDANERAAKSEEKAGRANRLGTLSLIVAVLALFVNFASLFTGRSSATDTGAASKSTSLVAPQPGPASAPAGVQKP